VKLFKKPDAPMRVGVYVDAFNLYYGARDWCRKTQSGWRWLDVVALAESLIAQRRKWVGAEIVRLVYCTALRDKVGDPSSLLDQENYISALKSDSRIHVEFGQYIEKVNVGALVNHRNRKNFAKPLDVRNLEIPPWLPHKTKTQSNGNEVMLVSVQTFEEKGSDVNVASHLLLDVPDKKIDAAVVISNDGDLQFAIAEARRRIPVGLLNPTKRHAVRLLMSDSNPKALDW